MPPIPSASLPSRSPFKAVVLSHNQVNSANSHQKPDSSEEGLKPAQSDTELAKFYLSIQVMKIHTAKKPKDILISDVISHIL